MAVIGAKNSTGDRRLHSSRKPTQFDLVTQPLTRAFEMRQFLTSAAASPGPTEETRVFRVSPMIKHTDHLVLHAAPDGSWLHPGAVIPVRVVADIDGDWPVYDPWTGLRTAGVLGGCMLLVVVYILYKTRCVGRVGSASKRRWTSKDRLFVEKYKRKVQERCSASRNVTSPNQRGTVASIVDVLHSNANYPIITIAASPLDQKHTMTSSNAVAINFCASQETRNCDVRVHERPTSAYSIISAVPEYSQLFRPSSAEPLPVSASGTFAERSSDRSVSVDGSRTLVTNGPSTPRSPEGCPPTTDFKMCVDARPSVTTCPVTSSQSLSAQGPAELSGPSQQTIASGLYNSGNSLTSHCEPDRCRFTVTSSDFASVTDGISRLCQQFSSADTDHTRCNESSTTDAQSRETLPQLEGQKLHISGINVRWRSLVDFTSSDTTSGGGRRIGIDEIRPPTTNV